MRAAAVTGVTGVIGKHIAENLLTRFFTVRDLARTARKDSTNKVRNVTLGE